jgi:tripartite-type tricarboxylate transporter receptor subunit TctC
MFRNINNFVLAVLAAVTLSTSAVAGEPINVIWAFNPGSNQATTLRIMIDKLNKVQNKYSFTFVHKPGAGGAVAAKAVTADPQHSIVGMSSSFQIGPLFKNNGTTHKLSDFTPVWVQGTGAPLVLVSKNFKTIDTLLSKDRITMGVSGVGSISHLLAAQIQSIHPNATIVNFKDMIAASTSAAGGNVDVAITYFVDSEGLRKDKLNLLGYTGSKQLVAGISTLASKMPDTVSLTANYSIYAAKTMPVAKLQEIHDLIAKVNNEKEIQDAYARDLLTVKSLSLEDSSKWYASELAVWAKFVSKIK